MNKRRFLTGKDFAWLLAAVIYNFSIYSLGRYLSADHMHRNLTTAFDRAVPFLPWMIVIYWGCYIYWVVNYCLGVAWRRQPYASARLPSSST